MANRSLNAVLENKILTKIFKFIVLVGVRLFCVKSLAKAADGFYMQKWFKKTKSISQFEKSLFRFSNFLQPSKPHEPQNTTDS